MQISGIYFLLKVSLDIFNQIIILLFLFVPTVGVIPYSKTEK